MASSTMHSQNNSLFIQWRNAFESLSHVFYVEMSEKWENFWVNSWSCTLYSWVLKIVIDGLSGLFFKNGSLCPWLQNLFNIFQKYSTWRIPRHKIASSWVSGGSKCIFVRRKPASMGHSYCFSKTSHCETLYLLVPDRRGNYYVKKERSMKRKMLRLIAS